MGRDQLEGVGRRRCSVIPYIYQVQPSAAHPASRSRTRRWSQEFELQAYTSTVGFVGETVPEPFLLISDMEDLRKIRPVDLLQP